MSNNINYTKCLDTNYRGSYTSIKGNRYAGINWAKGVTPISDSQLQSDWTAIATNETREREKLIALNDLTVDVDGLKFSADESKSLPRIQAAITAAEKIREMSDEDAADVFDITVDQMTLAGGKVALTASKEWKLANGSIKSVTLEQLKRVQAKIIVAIGNLVVDKYL